MQSTLAMAWLGGRCIKFQATLPVVGFRVMGLGLGVWVSGVQCLRVKGLAQLAFYSSTSLRKPQTPNPSPEP